MDTILTGAQLAFNQLELPKDTDEVSRLFQDRDQMLMMQLYADQVRKVK